jgi:succinoglycan biosynthesis protein ExoL
LRLTCKYLRTFSTNLNETVLNSPRKLQKSDSEVKVKIGLIGLLRYEKPIRWLINFVNNHSSDYELHCFGDGPFKSIVEESSNKNIYYHGSYKAHEQLEMIYKSIDLNFVVYDNNSKNVQLAIPNKLYESIYFCKPILVAKDTCLEKEVLNLKVGASVSLAGEAEFARDLSDVSEAKRMLFSNHSNNIDVSYLIDDSQNKLREIFKQ